MTRARHSSTGTYEKIYPISVLTCHIRLFDATEHEFDVKTELWITCRLGRVTPTLSTGTFEQIDPKSVLTYHSGVFDTAEHEYEIKTELWVTW